MLLSKLIHVNCRLIRSDFISACRILSLTTVLQSFFVKFCIDISGTVHLVKPV